MTPNMLGHFPRLMTAKTYKDVITFFIDIGFTAASPSLERLAAVLGFSFNATMLEHRNVAKRDDQNKMVQKLRTEFRDRHPLEFDVYDYARARFAPPASGGAREFGYPNDRGDSPCSQP